MKYRIIQIDDLFYPQMKRWFLFFPYWHTMRNGFDLPSEHKTKEEALRWLKNAIYEPKIIIHEINKGDI